MNPSRIARIALVSLPIVAVAGCSSSSADKPAAKKAAAAVKTTSSSSSTSSTTAAPTSGPPCTVAAASAVLAPDTASSIECGGGWAAGGATNTHYDYAFLLHDVNGTWTSIDNDQNQAEMQQACAAANPLGIPENVLAVSPCKVS